MWTEFSEARTLLETFTNKPKSQGNKKKKKNKKNPSEYNEWLAKVSTRGPNDIYKAGAAANLAVIAPFYLFVKPTKDRYTHINASFLKFLCSCLPWFKDRKPSGM